MPDGVAVPLPEKVLRALQDALPLHQALRPGHAPVIARTRLPPARRQVHAAERPGLAARCSGIQRLDLLAAILHALRLELSLLDQR